MKFIDIGANLTDTMYSGDYNGSSKHPPDLEAVLDRAKVAGVERMVVTGGSLAESRRAVEVASSRPGTLFATVGVHPTRCGEFRGHEEGEEQYFASLLQLIKDAGDTVVAVGECGLDYDRMFSPREVQRRWFTAQAELAVEVRTLAGCLAPNPYTLCSTSFLSRPAVARASRLSLIWALPRLECSHSSVSHSSYMSATSSRAAGSWGGPRLQ